MWKKLKLLVGNNGNTKPAYIDFPTSRETDPKQIAASCSNYFIESIKEIHESIEDIEENLDSTTNNSV